MSGDRDPGQAAVDTVVMGSRADSSDPARTDTIDAGPDTGRESSPQMDELPRGSAIGRFVVLGKLGAGGMGMVYSAYDPNLDRKVAIKLLRTGLGQSAMGARVRLLREAQAMAKINHPNVATIHEVGTLGDQVYLAIELVDGGTLQEWLGTRRRTRREILDAYTQAGRGLAAAHAAGLIHRDFKPDNVLITADGTALVTDFGIVGVDDDARLPRAPTDVDLPESPRLSGLTPISQQLTRPGAIMGTPIYMAPEQFRGVAANARADQFSFCAALYEALYGERPFAGITYEELETNVVAGRVSPPPRGTTVPGWLRRALLRGLASHPDERHPSMNALLAALAHDPAQRTRRLIGWGGAAACVAAVVGVIALSPDAADECSAGAAGASAAWSPARREQVKAAFTASGRPQAAATFSRLAGLLDGWDRTWRAGYADACKATHVRHAQSDALLDLRLQCLNRQLVDTGATVDLLIGGGEDAVDHALDAATALPPAAACADIDALTAAVPPPQNVEIRRQVEVVRALLGRAKGQRRLGRFPASLAIARVALSVAIATKYLAIEADALSVVGRFEVDLGAADGAETLRASLHAALESGDDRVLVFAATHLAYALIIGQKPYEQVYEVATLAAAVGKRIRLSGEGAVILDNVFGMMLEAHGDLGGAKARYEHGLEVARRDLGNDAPAVATSLTQLGNLARTENRYADARVILQEVLDLHQRVYGPEHPHVADALNNLGIVERLDGHLDKARELYEKALAVRIAALGPQHPDVAASYNNLGNFYSDQGDTAKSEEMFKKALALWERTYGPDSVEITMALLNLAHACVDRGDLASARMHDERSLAILERAHGRDDKSLAPVLTDLGVIAKKELRYKDAIALIERAIAITEKAGNADDVDLAEAMLNLATVHKETGRLEEAENLTVRSQAIVERALGADHPRVAMGLSNLGSVQRLRHEYAEAITSYKRSLAIFEARVGPDHPYVSYPLSGMAIALIALGRSREAVTMYERALAIRIKAEMPPGMIGEIRFGLAKALAGDRKTRARSMAEAKQALALFEADKDPESMATVKQWMKRRK